MGYRIALSQFSAECSAVLVLMVDTPAGELHAPAQRLRLPPQGHRWVPRASGLARGSEIWLWGAGQWGKRITKRACALAALAIADENVLLRTSADFGLAVFFEAKKLPLTNLGLEGTPW